MTQHTRVELIQLPNGNWIDPNSIVGVRAHQVRGEWYVSVDIVNPRNVYSVETIMVTGDALKAAECRDSYAALVNEARAFKAEGRS